MGRGAVSLRGAFADHGATAFEAVATLLAAWIALGVYLVGWALLVISILFRRRLLGLVGLGAVVADVTVAELGGFKAMNEARDD